MAARAAQEPQTSNIKLEWNTDIKMATLNVQGMFRVAKREEVEAWMEKRGVDILALQETHIPTSHKEKRSKHTWYFSGGEEQDNKGIHAGVAIVIRNELRNYIVQVAPVSDRIMYITLKGRRNMDVFSVYAPTAQADEQKKTTFYKELTAATKTSKSKNILFIMGDFNARIQTRLQG